MLQGKPNEDTKRARKALGAAGQGGSVERLLRVSLDLFAKSDYAAVSIKDIAQAGGVSTALIYYYFKNKQDLFRAGVEHAVRESHRQYKALARGHRSPVERIDDWFAINVDLCESLRKMIKIMFNYSGSGNSSGALDKMIADFYRNEREVLASAVRTGIEQGLFQPVDPDRLAEFVSIHIDGAFVASEIRGAELAAALADLKGFVWDLLGYREPTRTRGHADAAAE